MELIGIFLNASSGYDHTYLKNSVAVIMGLSTLLFSVLYWLVPSIRSYVKPLLMFSIIGLMIGLALVFSLKK